MLLTIAICTRNRPASLARTLESIAACEPAPDPGSWEVLVINNGQREDTSALEKNLGGLLPLRVAYEPEEGLSKARNSAVTMAKGEWVLWIDDDVTVDNRWLNCYTSIMSRETSISVMGGPITPDFEGQPPVWLTQGFEPIRSSFASRKACELQINFDAHGELPYGANFALRRSEALKHPFDPDLGRHPHWPVRGSEEVVVIRNILGATGTGLWLRDALVTHHIDRGRQNRRYVRSYYFDSGYVDTVRDEGDLDLSGKILRLAKIILLATHKELQAISARLAGQYDKEMLYLRNASRTWGRLKGYINSADLASVATSSGE